MKTNCNICCTEIKPGEEHGAGKCDSDSRHSGLGKLPRLTPVCEHCYQPYAFIDVPKHKDGKCNEICVNCGCPVHPCTPCSEVIQYHNHVDSEYFRLLQLILDGGRWTPNRTGVDTLGVFGAQAKFEVDTEAFPILTTKRVFFKGIVHELLWFLKGDTNIKYLVDNDVHIWDEWAYARYKKETEQGRTLTSGEPSGGMFDWTQEQFIGHIKKDPEFAKQWGELGEGTYGGMWRAFPYYTEIADGDQYGLNGAMIGAKGAVDQLAKVMAKLKNNPTDRRMIVSAWHPYWVDHCALPPCHCMFHFNTQELTREERWNLIEKYNWCEEKMCHYAQFRKDDPHLDEDMDSIGVPRRKLNLLLYQRSCDVFLGVPFNITSYCLLLAMVAHVVGMECGTFTHTYGDLHIYRNHMQQVDLQMGRTPKLLPKLRLNRAVKSLFEFKYEDIKLVDYESHPAIKAEVAV
jgi:thymidylate synthase